MKRFFVFLLCAVMLFGMTVGNAFAAETDAKAMEQVLKIVKSRVSIPESYHEFTCESRLQNNKTVWQFTWDAENNRSISVTADEKGRVIDYRHHTQVNENQVPKITKEKAKTIAEETIAKMLPETSGKLVLTGIRTQVYANQYYLKYTRFEHGVEVPNQTVGIEIDYRTGECLLVSSRIDYESSFAKPEQMISSTEVKKLWLDMAQLRLEYFVSYSRATLQYVPTGEVLPVNAHTGELVKNDVVWEENATEDGATAGGGASNSTMREELTPEELQKSEELADLLTKEEADAAVRKYSALAIGSNDRLYAANLRNDGEEYFWNLEYSGPVTKGQNPSYASATVNAADGKLEYFTVYSSSNQNQRRIKAESAIAIANTFSRAVAPDLQESLTSAKYLSEDSTDVPVEHVIVYQREHNGIPVSNNGLRMEINSASGKVTHFERNWENGVTFESADGIISLEDAENLFVNYAEPKLEYYTQQVLLYDVESKETNSDFGWNHSGIPTKNKIVLCYIQPNKIYKIEAKDGTVSPYGAYVDTPEIETYSDIAGHFAQQDIQLLLDIGILPKGDKFEPNRKITQLDLLCFVLSAQPKYRTYESGWSGSGYQIDKLYQTAIENGIIEEGERDPSKLMTRADAARIMIRCTEYGELAQNPKIFRTDYHDAAGIPQKDLGYVVVAKELGIMSGNNGMFYPTRIITRGEVVCMICKYLATVS